MHDIWNPWHGCVKCSEGCHNCYMYFLDRVRDRNGADIYKTKAGFIYPLQKLRDGSYKVKSGEMIRVCMTSDFFLEEADGLFRYGNPQSGFIHTALPKKLRALRKQTDM